MPIPNEVIAQVHRLATVAEKYDGTVFTNINGNVLSEQFNEDIDSESSAPDNQHVSYMEEHMTNINDENNEVGKTNDGNAIMSPETENTGNNVDVYQSSCLMKMNCLMMKTKMKTTQKIIMMKTWKTHMKSELL